MEEDKNRLREKLLVIGYIVLIILLFASLFHAYRMEKQCQQVVDKHIEALLYDDPCVSDCYGGINFEQTIETNWSILKSDGRLD